MPILDIPAADYHAMKAMSASMAWLMDAECPLKAWADSPWNEDREPVNAAHFDIGTACHLAVLEPHLFAERVITHSFEEYRTKESRAIRDTAWETGRTPLKPSELEIVNGVRERVLSHHHAALFMSPGTAEGTLTWEWDRVPCKARPDFIANDCSYILDLKSANSANPRAVARKAAIEGWHVRASWYIGGCKASMGVLPLRYLFVVVEKAAPHLVEIYELDDKALLYGEQIVMRSVARTKKCLETGKWPGYGDGGIVKLSLPVWTEFQRAEREEAGDFDV